MDDNTKALKIIVINALQALLTSDDEPLIRVRHESDIASNLFSFTLGAPESDDFGDADEPYLAVLVKVNTDDNKKFNCKIISCCLGNDPDEKTLMSQLNLENLRRSSRNQQDEDEN